MLSEAKHGVVWLFEWGKEKEAKKRDNAYYAEKVREASGPSNKAYYRRCKVDHAAAHDRTIASIKRDIESAKESLKRCK